MKTNCPQNRPPSIIVLDGSDRRSVQAWVARQLISERWLRSLEVASGHATPTPAAEVAEPIPA